MNNLVRHAEHELNLICDGKPDEIQASINKNILDIIKVFSEEDHSGTTAAYTADILNKLLRFEPLKPLTGNDDEWTEVTTGQWQNKRCSHVFKEADGKAYDINGKIFREPNGCCYTGSGSRVYIEFPYRPKSEYVDVPGEAA